VETIFERVGALDVHKAQVTACVRVPDHAGRRAPHLAEFSTTVQGLLALRDWLAAHRVTHVAMDHRRLPDARAWRWPPPSPASPPAPPK
jgi:transposase